MKPVFRFAAVLSLLALVAVSSAHAQDFRRNAYGMYAAPTIYGLSKGSDYNLATSNGGLDLGAYYSRAFTSSVSMRVEARYGTRALDYSARAKAPLSGAYLVFRVSEQILEVPVILEADRRIDMNGHEFKVSVGGGFSTKFVLDQKLFGPSGESDSPYNPIAADSYRKVGFLVDGGATFQVDRGSAVFARLRFDVDLATAGEPDDADVITRFWAAGFYAGFEYVF
jgi:hypothetical protein